MLSEVTATLYGRRAVRSVVATSDGRLTYLHVSERIERVHVFHELGLRVQRPHHTVYVVTRGKRNRTTSAEPATEDELVTGNVREMLDRVADAVDPEDVSELVFVGVHLFELLGIEARTAATRKGLKLRGGHEILLRPHLRYRR